MKFKFMCILFCTITLLSGCKLKISNEEKALSDSRRLITEQPDTTVQDVLEKRNTVDNKSKVQESARQSTTKRDEEEQEALLKKYELIDKAIANNISPEDMNTLKNIVIVIDAGHQKTGDLSEEGMAPNQTQTKPKVSSGTKGIFTGVPEYELTLIVAKGLKAQLEGMGAVVHMTRDTNDINMSNQERAFFSNNLNANLTIRLHADGSEDTSVSGFSVLIPSGTYIPDDNLINMSNNIGESINKSLSESTTAESHGVIKRSDLTGFNWSTVPSVLVEMGYMTNKEEDILLQTEEYQRKIIVGIAKGIVDYYKE